MASPKLPNLLDSLKSGSSGARGRGRGRGGSSTGSRGLTKDRVIQRTDQDALLSRLSAVKIGYLEDRFAHAFVDEEPPKRFPIINRGRTYVRSMAIDRLVQSFVKVSPDQKKQIISLGAGSDTRYFRLIFSDPSLNLVYHELDFKENTLPKVSAIQKKQSLLSAITSHRDNATTVRIDVHEGTITSQGYNLHAVDLRQFINPSDAPSLPNLSRDCPTLLLSECCLVYLQPSEVSSIITTFSQHLIPPPTPISLVLYEPIRPDDAFGRTMITNLENRGISMPTLTVFPSLASQRARLEEAGFNGGQSAADIKFLWERWVDEGEKERVAALEMMDEVEEWNLLAQHYCVAWGWRSADNDHDAFLRSWGNLPFQNDK
ncbi:leucine carboxyl methyltransferase [Eremomyces bilateralis CBS 781.70]|uniref:Leucine carboxyl methyltransferase 1 n=1 Tax=Eremomyces bilateralis CBS 781.70 TaxID=1392243 RepID=A0A6G1GE61_9PEZI|nr:leucine carboxyl methyltransferase [Eremomyces bilateralis CBS 781.70]KAF1816387.1 leucine carboxyl methyltransferase [Eremomyces bilateralis CBS 781.70]